VSEKILRWFGDKRNEKILGMTHEHLELTTKAVYTLYEMVQKMGTGSVEPKKYYETISKHEMEADQIRREMVTELSNRDLYPNERDDLMELVRAVDWIADWAREAGRLLLVISFETLPSEYKKSLENMCRENYNCVKVLDECIHELSENPKKALDLADEVEMLEENIDDLYSVARAFFVKLDESGMTWGEMILLNDFMDAVEAIADWCENTADIARAIAIRVI